MASAAITWEANRPFHGFEKFNTVIDVDDKNNEQKYKQLVNSIDNFSDEHLNRFPVINVKNYFIIIGYNYYYDDEIINDIKRMNKNSHLGKKLEKSRYIWRKQNDNQ